MSVSLRAAWCLIPALAGFGLWTAPAHAGTAPPDFTCTWDASNDLLSPMTFNWATGQGSDPVYGTHQLAGYEGTWDGWNYTGSITNDAWAMQFDIVFSGDSTVAGDTAAQTILYANMTVVNFDTNVQNFTLRMDLPVSAPLLDPAVSGSISGGLIANSDGGTASAPAGSSIYSAYIDSVLESQLMVDPFSENALANESKSFSQSFGSSAPVTASRNVDSEISIFLDVDLTGGDIASFSSAFAVYVPAPGALPVIALLGLAGRRRRRRA